MRHAGRGARLPAFRRPSHPSGPRAQRPGSPRPCASGLVLEAPSRRLEGSWARAPLSLPPTPRRTGGGAPPEHPRRVLIRTGFQELEAETTCLVPVVPLSLAEGSVSPGAGAGGARRPGRPGGSRVATRFCVMESER